MGTWSLTCLGHIANVTNGGAWSQAEYVDAGIPVVRVTDCQNGTVDLSDCKYLSPESLRRYEKHRLLEGDLIVATVGSHPTQPGSVVGRTVIVPGSAEGALLNQNAVCIRPQSESLDKDFIGFFGKSDAFRDYIISCARGSANQVRMSIELLKRMPVSLPPLPIQRKIAAILSAYDDLIENNTRRIAILEEMARALYREWFVYFRFPGHEKVKMVDSPLGKIPEGWEISTVGETFEFLGGGTPSKKVAEYWADGTIEWYTPTDLTSTGTMFKERSSMRISELGLAKSSAKLFPAYSVMMTSRATLGVIAINTTPACTNQGFITCIPNEEFPLHVLYHWLSDNVEKFISLGTGATFKEVTKGVFKTIDLLVPSAPVVTAFESIAEPMADTILNLMRRINHLRTTRDLLLPKLISGDVDVSDLDIEVPNAPNRDVTQSGLHTVAASSVERHIA